MRTLIRKGNNYEIFRIFEKNKDFQTVYRQGKSYANKYLVLYIMENQTERKTGIGISVSKEVGNSVVRHHLTRLIREAIDFKKNVSKEDMI